MYLMMSGFLSSFEAPLNIIIALSSAAAWQILLLLLLLRSRAHRREYSCIPTFELGK
jgi:hypothetical protein